MERILIATRGEFARRLIRQYGEAGVETVAVFSEPDEDGPWVEEADFAVYLNGSTVAETYMNPQRVLSAAMDAGCDAVHPGYCFLAERVDFYSLAANANMAVIGAEPRALLRVMDQFAVRRVAEELSIPVIPSSMPLAHDDDGIEEAARLGLPLYVKAVAGGVVQRVESFEQLAEAIADTRRRAEALTGESAVYLQRAVDQLRHVATTVVADGHGEVAALGHADRSLQVGFRSWAEEMGVDIVGEELHTRMSQAAIALASQLGWMGIGRVRWAITPNGGWYLLGFSGRLTTGYSLAEAVFGVDLVRTQWRTALGDYLAWDHAALTPSCHGIQLRLLHVDDYDGVSRPEGVVERLDLPESVFSEVGVAVGQRCTPQTEPILATLVVTAPTRQAAIVRARAALDEVVIEGVSSNLRALREVLGDADFWAGTHDVNVLDRYLTRS